MDKLYILSKAVKSRACTTLVKLYTASVLKSSDMARWPRSISANVLNSHHRISNEVFIPTMMKKQRGRSLHRWWQPSLVKWLSLHCTLPLTQKQPCDDTSAAGLFSQPVDSGQWKANGRMVDCWHAQLKKESGSVHLNSRPLLPRFVDHTATHMHSASHLWKKKWEESFHKLFLHNGTLQHTQLPYWFSMMVCYSVPELKYSCRKMAFIWKLNAPETNETIETVLCHVLFPDNMHAITKMKFQGCTDFLWFLITCTNPLVWYSCQGKQSASSEWVNTKQNTNYNNKWYQLRHPGTVEVAYNEVGYNEFWI